MFAQLAAVFGSVGAGANALWQVIPLLVLIVLYWAYVRFFVPLAFFADLAAEVSILNQSANQSSTWSMNQASRERSRNGRQGAASNRPRRRRPVPAAPARRGGRLAAGGGNSGCQRAAHWAARHAAVRTPPLSPSSIPPPPTHPPPPTPTTPPTPPHPTHPTPTHPPTHPPCLAPADHQLRRRPGDLCVRHPCGRPGCSSESHKLGRCADVAGLWRFSLG
mgnify:CR=1 FL=1